VTGWLLRIFSALALAGFAAAVCLEGRGRQWTPV